MFGLRSDYSQCFDSPVAGFTQFTFTDGFNIHLNNGNMVF